MGIKFNKSTLKVTCNEINEDSSGLTETFLPFEKTTANNTTTYKIHVKELEETDSATSIKFTRSSSKFVCKQIIEE